MLFFIARCITVSLLTLCFLKISFDSNDLKVYHLALGPISGTKYNYL